MKVLVALLVCGIVVGGDAQARENEGLEGIEDLGKTIEDVLRNNLPEGEEIPAGATIPGFGTRRACPASLSKTEYINCCEPQNTCKGETAITRETVEEVTCGALRKVVKSSNLQQVLGAVTSQSSGCLKETAVDSFQKVNGPASGWTDTTFEKLPTEAVSGLNTSSLEKLNPELFKNTRSLEKIGKSMQDMTEEQIKGVVPGLKKAYGDLKQWTKQTLKKVVTLAPKTLCGLSSTEVKELSDASLTESIGAVSTAVTGCQGQHGEPIRQTILKSFRREKGEVNTWTAQTLNSLNGLKSSIRSTEFGSMTKEALTDSSTLPATDNVLNRAQKLAIVDAVSDLAVAAEAESPAEAILQDIPSALPLLRRSAIAALNCSVLQTYFMQSAQKKVPDQSLQHIVQRLKTCGLSAVQGTASSPYSGAASVADLTTTDVQSITPFLGAFSSADIGQMNLKPALKVTNASLPAGLSSIQRTVITRKLVGGSRAKRATDATSPPLELTQLPSELGPSLTAADIGKLAPTVAAIKSATEQGLSVAKDVAASFADIALAALGSDLSNVTSYPSNTIFKKLGKNIVRGFNRTTLNKVPLDSLSGFASSASEFDLSAGQMDTMVKRFTADVASTFSESDVRGLGPMVTQIAESVVEKMPEGAKAQIARNFGQSKRVLGLAGNTKMVKQITEKALGYLKVDKTSLTCAQVETLGVLAHNLEANTLATLNKNEMAACVSQLSQNQPGETPVAAEQRLRKVATTVHKVLKGSSSGLDADVVEGLGDAACHLPDSYFSTLTTAANFNQVFETLGRASCDATSTAAKTVVSKAKEHHTGGSGKVRDLSRQALRTINKALPAMSTEDIKDITSTSVLDSLPTFGEARFSTAQSVQIIEKIAPGATTVRARRNTNDNQATLTGADNEATLTGADVKSLGRLACSVQPKFLQNFLGDVDAVESLSKPDCFTPARKRELIAAVKKPAAQGEPSTWTDIVVSSLGEWTSGLSASDVSSIPVPVFKASVKSLGKQKNVPVATMEALGEAATKTFGAKVESWSEGTIASLGAIVGSVGIGAQGCKTGVVQKFTSDQLGAIAPESVPAMRNLHCLASEQIKSLDGEQARAITPAQTSALSASQQQVVTQISCYPNCVAAQSGPGSGAAGLSVTAALVVAAVLAAWAF